MGQSKFKLFRFNILLCLVFLHHWTSAQNKIMGPEVYKMWNSIADVQISNDGSLVSYVLNNDGGDKVLKLYRKSDGKTFSFENVKSYTLDPDGNYLIFTKNLHPDTLKQYKLQKKDEKNLPLDSLMVFRLSDETMTSVGDELEYHLPKNNSKHLYYITKVKSPEQDSVGTKSSIKETHGTIRNMSTGSEVKLQYIKKMIAPKDSLDLMCIGYNAKDTTDLYLLHYHFMDGSIDTILRSQKEIKNLLWSADGKYFICHAIDTTLKIKNKPYKILLYSNSGLTDLTPKIREISQRNWVVNNENAPFFSEDGSAVYVHFRPKVPEKDTTVLDDDVVHVEIWKSDMPQLYTQMEANKDILKKGSLIRYDLNTRMTHELVNDGDSKAILTYNFNPTRYVLLADHKPYLSEVTWYGELHSDVYVLDTYTGMKQEIAKNLNKDPEISPSGRYAIWYGSEDSTYYLHDMQWNQKSKLSKEIKYYDERHDTPQLPDSYGVAGWMENDEAVFIYDAYDIWKIDPKDPMTAIPLTNGRSSYTRYRIVNVNKEKPEISKNALLLLNAFNEDDKSESLVYLNLLSGKIVTMVNGPFHFSTSIIKAKKSPWWIFTKENFEVFPDLMLADTTFAHLSKISDANPFQIDYTWGKSALVHWTNYNGTKNMGLFYFPANFDPNKKYPLIVNFYERSSDELNRHRAPYAHRSTISYSYYTNRGYCIFNPDITYTVGQPGQDCYNAVMSGVDSLVHLSFIDSTKMGLQGHSWGGYQVAYLITQTDRFTCAESGAPVVNMTSAYGGIRWESGMSRMFQYEKAQSRLGSTLWDGQEKFIKNSPVFFIDKVKTPVLILHNDEDGAVPWYQGIEFYMALRRLDKPGWLLNYNKEPHWPVKWQNRLDFNIRMQQFFDHFLQGAPLPLWMKEGITPQENGILKKYNF